MKIKIQKLKFIRNIIIGIVALLIVAFIINIAPGYKRNKFQNVTNLIIGDENVTENLKKPIYKDEEENIYISKEDIEQFLDKTIYYDEENDILKEVYKVSDQGNRNLALRYDLTVPFAKYIAINQNTKLPFKRYEIGEVFRNGPVKLGRDREFIQCDVDTVGIEGQLVEAEFVALYVEAYKELGIDVIIKYNNRK